MRRAPGFTAAAIFALAVGIGANVAIFSTLNAVLLNSLPFRAIQAPERLVTIYETNPALLQFMAGHLPVRFTNFEAWRKQAKSFAGMEFYQGTRLDLSSAGQSEPEQVEAATASQGFFPLLGVTPRMGRNFSPADGGHVALLSDDTWRSRFHSDPQIVGKTLRASNAEYQIIGVLPASFQLPGSGPGSDTNKPGVWTLAPLHPTTEQQNTMALSVIARLRPGATLGEAQAEMKVIADRLAKENPDANRGWGANVLSTIEDDIDPDVRRSLLVIQFAVGFVLLIACANVANLLLTKAVAREKEMSIRFAIGASRFRIARQNLTESLLLGGLGGAAGLLLSLVLMRIVSYLAPKDVHGFHELAIDPLVLSFAVGVSLLSGLLFGLAPSLHSIHQSIAEGLSHGSRSVAGSSRRFRAALIVFEIALSLVLLVGAGLTIRSLAALLGQDQGFQTSHLLTMSIALPSYRYQNPQQVAAFDDQLLARVKQLPAVEAASLASALPMRTISERNYGLPGVAVDPTKLKVTDWARVTEGHTRALGLRLLSGRDLTRADVEAPHPDVALVNELFARATWPNENPLGKVFTFAGEDGKEMNYKVVGLVSSAHQFGPDSDSHPEVYLPSRHMQSMLVLVRTAGDPLAMAQTVKRQVWALDKDQTISQVDSMQNMLSEWIAPRRFTMTVMIAFGAIALISAAVGLYSVLAYAVSLRKREIGVRVALGADPRQVAGMVLKEGATLAAAGVVLGLAAAFALARFMQSLIFGVSAFDAATFAGVSLLLAAVAITASYLPARRASMIDPTEALRAE